jgi:hypothetical protein
MARKVYQGVRATTQIETAQIPRNFFVLHIRFEEYILLHAQTPLT